jgi:hypothetical protein
MYGERKKSIVWKPQYGNKVHTREKRQKFVRLTENCGYDCDIKRRRIRIRKKKRTRYELQRKVTLQ